MCEHGDNIVCEHGGNISEHGWQCIERVNRVAIYRACEQDAI